MRGALRFTKTIRLRAGGVYFTRGRIHTHSCLHQHIPSEYNSNKVLLLLTEPAVV